MVLKQEDVFLEIHTLSMASGGAHKELSLELVLKKDQTEIDRHIIKKTVGDYKELTLEYIHKEDQKEICRNTINVHKSHVTSGRLCNPVVQLLTLMFLFLLTNLKHVFLFLKAYALDSGCFCVVDKGQKKNVENVGKRS